MKVYELIQELVQYSADAEVRIKAHIDEFEVDCKHCDDATPVNEDTYSLDIDEIRGSKREVEICCEE